MHTQTHTHIHTHTQVYEYEDSGRISRVTVAFQSRQTNTLPAEVQVTKLSNVTRPK